MSRMNPLNLTEPFSAKVHRQKTHDVAAITRENEPYEPFLDMVWGVAEKKIASLKRRLSPRSDSCSKSVHRVHRFNISRRHLAVLGNEPVTRDVHTVFRGFMPMKGGVATSPEAICPVVPRNPSAIQRSSNISHEARKPTHGGTTDPRAFRAVISGV